MLVSGSVSGEDHGSIKLVLRTDEIDPDKVALQDTAVVEVSVKNLRNDYTEIAEISGIIEELGHVFIENPMEKWLVDISGILSATLSVFCHITFLAGQSPLWGFLGSYGCLDVPDRKLG